MKTSLHKGLDAQGKKDVDAAYAASLPLRKQLIKILNERIEFERTETCKKGVTNEQGDFAVKMAHNMGYEQATREIIKLFS